MKGLSDIISGVIGILISTFFIVYTNSFKELAKTDKLGPAFFPKMFSIIVICLSIILILNGIKSKKTYFGMLKDKNLVLMSKSIFITIVYLIVFGKIHFIITTTLYIITLGVIYRRKLISLIPMSILGSSIIYYIFGSLFHVLL